MPCHSLIWNFSHNSSGYARCQFLANQLLVGLRSFQESGVVSHASVLHVCRSLCAQQLKPPSAGDVQRIARSIFSRSVVAIISHFREEKPSWIGSSHAPYQERAGLRGLGRHYLLPSSGCGCWAITHTDWTYLHCIYRKTFASLIRHLCHLVTTAEYDQPPTGCPAAYFHILHTGSCLFA